MSQWGSVKASRVLAALTRIGWRVKRQMRSHRTLKSQRLPDHLRAACMLRCLRADRFAERRSPARDGTELPQEGNARC
jgi:hypothetical protein